MLNPPLSPNTVQTVTNFTASLASTLLPNLDGSSNTAGDAIFVSLKGFKLDTTFLNMVQMMDNSKRVALVGGGTVAITNNVRAGTTTLNAVRTSSDMMKGDAVLIATYLQGMADSVGSLLTFGWGFGGAIETLELYGVTFVSCPPLILAGNDLPDYPIVFSYADFKRG